MVLLVDGLRAMATVATKPAAAVAPLGLAAIAFAALIRFETRQNHPLLDFGLFRSWNFALACALTFLLMSDIMAILLYYNLSVAGRAWPNAHRRRPFAHAPVGPRCSALRGWLPGSPPQSAFGQ